MKVFDEYIQGFDDEGMMPGFEEEVQMQLTYSRELFSEARLFPA